MPLDMASVDLVVFMTKSTRQAAGEGPKESAFPQRKQASLSYQALHDDALSSITISHSRVDGRETPRIMQTDHVGKLFDEDSLGLT